LVTGGPCKREEKPFVDKEKRSTFSKNAVLSFVGAGRNNIDQTDLLPFNIELYIRI